MTVATYFTLVRILAIPFVFWLWKLGDFPAALLLMALAMATDYIDGKVARALGQVTVAGAILDPVADKVTVMSYQTYLYLVGALPWWVYLPTMTRNLSQLSAIPVLNWWLKIPFNVKPKSMPKWATAISFAVALLGMILLPGATRIAQSAWLVLCAISTILEVWILVEFLPRFYLIATRRHDTFE